MGSKLKNFIAVLISVCVFLTVSACGGNDGDQTGGTGSTDTGEKWTIQRVYDKAVDLGFEGSLDDLIALFKGDKGEQGEQGQQGEQGEKGEKGDKGDTGDDGVGIKDIKVNEENRLIITLTNDRVIDCGPIVEGNSEESNTQCLDFYPLDDGTYGVSVGKAIYLSYIDIPETYCGKPVSKILENGFSNLEYLKKISVPDSVKEIGEFAFTSCKSLNTVVIGKNSALQNIGRAAFNGCESLLSFTLTDDVVSIGEDAFLGCKIAEVYNYSSLNVIKGETENGCIGLNAFDIYTSDQPSKICISGDFAFYDGEVNYLIDYRGTNVDITLPDDFNGEEYAIYKRAFEWKSFIKSVSTSKDSKISEIGATAFKGCSELKEFILPESVLKINEQAFYNCVLLTDFTVPYSGKLTFIGEGVFTGCCELKEFIIPIGVTTIERSAFFGTNKLTIYAAAAEKPACWHADWNNSGAQVIWGYNGE